MPLIPLGQLPAHHAARDPRRPAITLGDTVVTREGLEVRANRRARVLRGHGVGMGDIVTVGLPNGIELYETTFALWKLGAIPNMVSSKLPDGELGAIVQLADPRLVIGVEPGRLPGRSVVAAGAPVDQTLSAEPLEPAVSPHWKAMTSGGSTGRPKIIVDHMAGAFDPEIPSLLQQVDDVLLNPGPLYHNAPFGLTHSGLFVGAHVIEMGGFDAAEALRLIGRHKVQWVNFVPTMMARIWKLPADQRQAADISSLRVVFHMASPCPVWLKEAWIDWIGAERLFELYGGTEGQGLTVISGEEWLAHRGSVGKVLPGSAMRVLDADGKDCAPGQIGEVFFRPDAGRNSTYHYIGAEAKAAGDWESLGDLGHMDADGYLYLADRRTDLILSGGANIYPAEVEAALDSHPDVLTSAVVGLPDDDLGQRAHAIVQPRDGAQLSQDALIRHLEPRLVRYKIPRSFEFSAAPLRDDAGKTRRSALRDQRLPKPAAGR
jgi:bile acid-coenzyme A ligase